MPKTNLFDSLVTCLFNYSNDISFLGYILCKIKKQSNLNSLSHNYKI
ncbi:hypothetical protein CCAND38_230034 [Capnocytophaga canis]|uniref:Uncharacterized protein n=1 Tax=Capnocytophaga canis TaxID=1848903 RepID=A0A0B7I542_9FLAO|nr:hypothetical protein CCAND38_230034 [Capnocytophaga canis]